MRLSFYTSKPRFDNNFHLIRILSACAVLISHGFVLATGDVTREPFVQSLGLTLGSVAVDIFFLASGMLVTGSLLTKKNLIDFSLSRALRIFPALLAMLVLTVFVMGPLLTTNSFIEFMTSGETYQYFLKSVSLLTGMGKTLPGVFEDNPFPRTVNGSLWTLRYELRMYVILALVWLVVSPFKAGEVVYKAAILLTAVLAGMVHVSSCLGYSAYAQSNQLTFMFFAGASFYILRNRIILSWRVFFVFVCGLILAGLSGFLFLACYALTIPYLLFFLAYVPTRFLRSFNTVGDYSYGIYLYAFPVQQMVVGYMPGVGVWRAIFISGCIVFLLAWLSWHLLEKRALTFKKRLI